MKDDNLLNMPIVLAGRTYPVLVATDEVDSIKQITAQLQREVSDLHKRYSNQLNKQDILAMLLLTYAKDLHEEKQQNCLTPIKNRIESIENVLNQAFDKK